LNTVLLILGNQVEASGSIGLAYREFCMSAFRYMLEHPSEPILTMFLPRNFNKNTQHAFREAECVLCDAAVCQ